MNNGNTVQIRLIELHLYFNSTAVLLLLDQEHNGDGDQPLLDMNLQPYSNQTRLTTSRHFFANINTLSYFLTGRGNYLHFKNAGVKATQRWVKCLTKPTTVIV